MHRGFPEHGGHKSSQLLSWSLVRREMQWGRSTSLLLAWLNDLLIAIDWTPGISSHVSGLISVTILPPLCSIEKHAGKSPTGHQNMTHPRLISQSRRRSQMVWEPGGLEQGASSQAGTAGRVTEVTKLELRLLHALIDVWVSTEHNSKEPESGCQMKGFLKQSWCHCQIGPTHLPFWTSLI